MKTASELFEELKRLEARIKHARHVSTLISIEREVARLGSNIHERTVLEWAEFHFTKGSLNLKAVLLARHHQASQEAFERLWKMSPRDSLLAAFKDFERCMSFLDINAGSDMGGSVHEMALRNRCVFEMWVVHSVLVVRYRDTENRAPRLRNYKHSMDGADRRHIHRFIQHKFEITSHLS